MPIYEYSCNNCGKEFELLVFGSSAVSCPHCENSDITKKMSTFGMSGVDKPFAGTDTGCTSCSKTSCSSCN
ncbi:MAG: zinc ribbon domain-containing protein [Nitrospirota bacterium]|nr:MAG: zinc ribbon domain-containing protein [Nitrospirota bacterium]